MTPVTDRSFGILIAFVLPGFLAVALWLPLIPGGGELLYGTTPTGPTVGGFLYVTLAAIWTGLVLSTLRWLLMDHLHHLTGIRPPNWQIARSPATVEAYRIAVELHYRYYQFYGSNLLVFGSLAFYPPSAPYGVWLTSTLARGAVIFLALLFFAASRDTLRKYYARCQALAAANSVTPFEGTQTMSNGGDHSHHSGTVTPPAKPEAAAGQAVVSKAAEAKAAPAKKEESKKL